MAELCWAAFYASWLARFDMILQHSVIFLNQELDQLYSGYLK